MRAVQRDMLMRQVDALAGDLEGGGPWRYPTARRPLLMGETDAGAAVSWGGGPW